MDSSDEEAVRLAIEKDRLSVMKAKERWQRQQARRRAATRTGLFYQPWRKIWTYKKDAQTDTLAAGIRL